MRVKGCDEVTGGEVRRRRSAVKSRGNVNKGRIKRGERYMSERRLIR